MNLRILPTGYARQNRHRVYVCVGCLKFNVLRCRRHWSHSHLDFRAVLFCTLWLTSTMTQCGLSDYEWVPNGAQSEPMWNQNFSRNSETCGIWIFRTSTAVSSQCLPQFSAEWNIASSSNPFQNCFLWRGHMCVRGRFQRHTRKIDFAQNKSDCGLSAGIRLWGPVMDFYRPFVVGWQDRVANFLDNVQRQNRGVLNTVEQCWTLLRHCVAHWMFKKTPIPPVHFYPALNTYM